MATSSHFTQSKRDWSARKHAVLSKYFPAFCTALSGQGTIWYVDGFAGAGTYRDQSNPNAPIEPGSPVIAAEIAQQKSYDIRCYNVEEDPSNFDSLVEATGHYPHVINVKADFSQVVEKILATVKGQPAFFFLDPFGTKDLPMTGVIERIALRPFATDILVRYATETVRRLAGAYEKDEERRNAHAQNLDAWFRGNGWRQIVEQVPAGPDRDSQLLQYYLDQIVSISGGRLRYARAYPIRTLEDYTKYHLVFATGNRLGIKLMSQVLYEAENQFTQDKASYEEQKRVATQMSLFEMITSPEQQYEQHINEIRDSILRAAHSGRVTWNFDDLMVELILEYGWFARMSEREYRAALKSLYDKGQVVRLSTGNAWSRYTRFRIEA